MTDQRREGTCGASGRDRPPGGDGRPPPRRALVLDDDAFVRRVLEDALDARGFQVLTAADGLEGLHALLEELLDLDVVVTDLAMPQMDGERFIRTVREAGGEHTLRIVVVTGTTADRGRLQALGADAVLAKQDGLAAVVEAIDRAAEASAGDRALHALAVAARTWPPSPGRS
jgi:CheY-like chemotaxis protein